ncbi:hypothetical protein GCM10008170_21590 [Methylopila capsulata]|nr:hypothetical protein GCM10008170_21590 [Methylopila capsulata]
MSCDTHNAGALNLWSIDNVRLVPLSWLRHLGSNCFLDIPVVGEIYISFSEDPVRPGPFFDLWSDRAPDNDPAKWQQAGVFEFVFGPIRASVNAPVTPRGRGRDTRPIWKPVFWSYCLAPFLILAAVLGAVWWRVYHLLIVPPVRRLLWRPLKAVLKVALRPVLNPQHRVAVL